MRKLIRSAGVALVAAAARSPLALLATALALSACALRPASGPPPAPAAASQLSAVLLPPLIPPQVPLPAWCRIP